MIKLIVIVLVIVLFSLLGYLTQAIKKTFEVITLLILRILNLFGIKIIHKERSANTSEEFRKVYKGIRKVKLSRKNLKTQSSVSWLYLSIFLVSLSLVILNLNVLTGNILSQWLCEIMLLIKIPIALVSMNTFVTAVLFSLVSFSLTRVIQHWKDTKVFRKERHDRKLKEKAMAMLTTKELLNAAREKDENEYKGLK